VVVVAVAAAAAAAAAALHAAAIWQVIQNEFGAVGVDHLLVAKHFEGNEQILQMNNGCLCCTVKDDLAPMVQDLFLGQTESGKLDGIIVEVCPPAAAKAFAEKAWPRQAPVEISPPFVKHDIGVAPSAALR
jgi:G3E family GTPase